jgi:hypothetical protein
MRFLILNIVLLILVTFISCKKENSVIKNVDYSYFPLDTNSWIIYNIESINIDQPSGINDTLNYKIKEVVESAFIDEEGRTNYRLERYLKLNNSSAWVLTDVWSTLINGKFAIKNEENIPYVKLVFPAKLNSRWNGNSLNTLDEQEYEYTAIDENEIIDSLSFDSTVTVTQMDELNLIEKKYQVEKYAKNIGLIYKETTDIYSDKILPSVPIEQRVKTGTIFKMKIIAHGK